MINVAFESINPTPTLPAALKGVSFSHYHWDSRAKAVVAFKAFVKAALRALQVGQCCFCRRQLADDITVDIEHFLEKASVPAMTFEILNLALSCKTCNNKKAQFYKRKLKRLKLFAIRNGHPPPTGECSGLHRGFNNSKLLSAQDYIWVHPHFHRYSEHIIIHCGWIYESKTSHGLRTIHALELNKIGEIERRSLRERIIARKNQSPDTFSSIDLNFNYEQIMKELAVVLKDIAAAQP